MTIDFITLFDSSYMAQGLTMVRSLFRTTPDARVWVVAADEQVAEVLTLVGHEDLRVVSLADVETDELRAVRSTRSRLEYYWTLTPFLPSFVFAQDQNSNLAVYVDADMYFMKSAHLILEEFLENLDAVSMITPHDYLPEYDQSTASGKFCVQFMPFSRNGSELILKYWQQQCLEWCFNRVEPGRFGDQKYLDLWPERFGSAIHVQERVDLLGAPWNARVRVLQNLIAYHFHGLRAVTGQILSLHLGYSLPPRLDDAIYLPYLEDLVYSVTLLRAHVPDATASPQIGSANLMRLAIGSLRTAPQMPAVRRLPAPGPQRF